MNLSELTGWLTAAASFLWANPIIAIVIFAVLLFLIDPILVGFLIVAAIIWFALHLPH